ncbi:carbohydrate ABC transporter membrane protein 2 (CUT1 family) [Murinocardiopsis flavida]|uniref:Carbohydrate ABC transporter membrane protein 2 (CUT1 family) n=1 Tax=Murinocardiopsis flavida TaxID=645275 RepID=A0A2P8DQ43_9ACTN|nr:carbohydrate ABC transporter permease [Murinocardiopsis flavida]PSK99312.1 carbohydrate ABC transporter membrane protein 2 (CUT1 family) [Murinocardiopsis flavida]
MSDTIIRTERRPETPQSPRTSGGPDTRRRAPAATLVKYVLLIGAAAVFLGPLFWLFTAVFKTPEEIYRFPPAWLPTSLSLDNFTAAWQAAPFDRFFLNSAITTAVGTALKVANAVLTAYAFCFLAFPYKKPLFLVLLGAMMVPGHVVLLPNYLTVASLGWVNTYAGLILPGVGSVFATFLMRQHMLTIPRDIIEAAKVDGSGHLRTLFTIVLPMSRPILLTVLIITVVEEWNNFIWPLIVTNSDHMRTLPIGLLMLKDQEGLANWGTIMAGTAMVLAPMLLIFLLAQRYIVGGLTQGAVKG